MSKIWKNLPKLLKNRKKKKIDYFASLRYSSSLVIGGIAQLGERMVRNH